MSVSKCAINLPKRVSCCPLFPNTTARKCMIHMAIMLGLFPTLADTSDKGTMSLGGWENDFLRLDFEFSGHQEEVAEIVFL